MNKNLALCVIILLLALALPGTGIEDEADDVSIPDEYLHKRPDLSRSDLARLRPLPFEEVTIAALGDTDPIPASGLVSEDAGCDTGYEATGWAVSGTPESPCAYETHDWGIRYAVHDCPNGCYSDGWHEDFLALFIFTCTPGGRAIFDFESLQAVNLGTGECSVVGFGHLPTQWDHWSGEGWVRDMRFSYTDNLGDALVHLIA